MSLLGATTSVSAFLNRDQSHVEGHIQCPCTRDKGKDTGAATAPERRGVLILKEPGRDSFPKGRNLSQTRLGTET